MSEKKLEKGYSFNKEKKVNIIFQETKSWFSDKVGLKLNISQQRDLKSLITKNDEVKNIAGKFLKFEFKIPFKDNYPTKLEDGFYAWVWSPKDNAEKKAQNKFRKKISKEDYFNLRDEINMKNEGNFRI